MREIEGEPSFVGLLATLTSRIAALIITLAFVTVGIYFFLYVAAHALTWLLVHFPLTNQH